MDRLGSRKHHAWLQMLHEEGFTQWTLYLISPLQRGFFTDRHGRQL